LSPRAALSRTWCEKKKAAINIDTETVKENPTARIVGTKRKVEDVKKIPREEALDKARRTSLYQKFNNNLQNQMITCGTDKLADIKDLSEHMREQHEEVLIRLSRIPRKRLRKEKKR